MSDVFLKGKCSFCDHIGFDLTRVGRVGNTVICPSCEQVEKAKQLTAYHSRECPTCKGSGRVDGRK